MTPHLSHVERSNWKTMYTLTTFRDFAHILRCSTHLRVLPEDPLQSLQVLALTHQCSILSWEWAIPWPSGRKWLDCWCLQTVLQGYVTNAHNLLSLLIPTATRWFWDNATSFLQDYNIPLTILLAHLTTRGRQSVNTTHSLSLLPLSYLLRMSERPCSGHIPKSQSYTMLGVLGLT